MCSFRCLLPLLAPTACSRCSLPLVHFHKLFAFAWSSAQFTCRMGSRLKIKSANKQHKIKKLKWRTTIYSLLRNERMCGVLIFKRMRVLDNANTCTEFFRACMCIRACVYVHTISICSRRNVITTSVTLWLCVLHYYSFKLIMHMRYALRKVQDRV